MEKVYLIEMDNCEPYEDNYTWIDSAWGTLADAVRYLSDIRLMEESTYPIPRSALNEPDLFHDGMRHTWVEYDNGDDLRHDGMTEASIIEMTVGSKGDVMPDTTDDSDEAWYDASQRCVIGLAEINTLYRDYSADPDDDGEEVRVIGAYANDKETIIRYYPYLRCYTEYPTYRETREKKETRACLIGSDGAFRFITKPGTIVSKMEGMEQITLPVLDKDSVMLVFRHVVHEYRDADIKPSGDGFDITYGTQFDDGILHVYKTFAYEHDYEPE